jgi:hypothetical protein
MTEQIGRGVHVDRTEELARFDDMLAGRGTAHVLLIQAEAGMGKSSLLREFWDRGSDAFKAFVDLKPRTQSVVDVLIELSSYNKARFPRFSQKVAELSGSRGVYINQSEIKKSQVSIQLEGGGADERELRRQVLTASFFADLEDSRVDGDMAMIIFDTHENASEDVKDWLSRAFLPAAREHRWLVVVIAGQSTPELRIGWDDWCLEQTLRPLGPEHLGEYVRRVKLELSENEILMLYDLTDGIPVWVSTQVGKLLLKRGRGGG